MKTTRTNHTHGGDLSQFLKTFGFEGDKIYDFSVNTFPYKLPHEFCRFLTRSIDALTQYPDPHSTNFISAVSMAALISDPCIIPLNGSAQGMYALCSMPEIQSVYTVEPTFIEYKLAAQAYQKHWIPIPRNRVMNQEHGWIHDLAPQSLVFLCNPNNPDGGLFPKKQILSLCETPSFVNSWLIVDEAFIEFAPHESVMESVERYENLIVLRSLTKYFGLAGLRCGYLASHPNRTPCLRPFIPPWSLNSLSQIAAEWVLLHPRDFHQAKTTWLTDAQKLQEEFRSFPGITVYPTVTSYFLIHFDELNAARLFQQSLAQQGVMVRNCANYEGLDESYIRIGARDEESNAFLIDTLRAAPFKEAPGWI